MARYFTIRSIFSSVAVFLLTGLLVFSGCAPGKKGARIQLATWGSAQEMAVLNRRLEAFRAAHPEVDVELLHIPDNYYQKLHILIASGMMPDVVFTNSISFPVYAAHGLFADLSPYVQGSGQLSPKVFYPQARQAFELAPWTGQPGLGAVPRDISNLVMFVNRSRFAEAGLTPPSSDWTWADLRRLGTALTEDTDGDGRPERYGVSFYRKPPLFWRPFVWSAGGAVLSEDRQRLALDSPAAVEGLEFYARWPNAWHIAPRREESGGATMSQMFLQGRLAMMVSGRWSVPILREQAEFDWDVVPLPAGPAGSRTGIDASGYAMAAGTKHPEAAWALIEFLSSPESVSAFARSGLIIPARRDVANSDVFLAPDQAPQSARAFLDVIETGVPTRSHPRWNELSEVIGLELEPLWDGRIDAATAAENAQAKASPLLEAAP